MKSIIFFIFILSVPAICFAQYGNETITITTYYPSPYGVYGILNLYPKDVEPQNPMQGDLYFNKTSESVMYYKNITAGFVPVGGGASAGDILVYASHTKDDCTKAGGKVDDSGTSYKQCRFALPSCPPGWLQYLNWSNTTARYCGWEGVCCWGGPSTHCSVDGHPWSNIAIEHCTHLGASMTCDWTKPQTPECESVCYRAPVNYCACPCVDCSATVNEIGCY
jgi:hypothetical protein